MLIIDNQQHFFSFPLPFFWLSLALGTSTGIKLKISEYFTFIIFYFRLKLEQFSQRLLKLLHDFLHLFSNGWFLDVFVGIHLRLILILHVLILYRLCCPLEWKGIFKVLEGTLGSRIPISTNQYSQKTTQYKLKHTFRLVIS